MNSLNCKQIQAELLDYIEREMSSDERERVLEHLAECHDCNMEYKGLRAMLNKTKKLAIDDPGAEFWRQLPQKVLVEVRQHRFPATADNIVNLAAQRHTLKNNAHNSAEYQSHYQQSSCVKNPVVNFPPNFQDHRLTAAAAIAAVLLLVINVMVFSPKSGYSWFNQASFQARIETDKGLSKLAQTLAPPLTANTDSAPLGFVEQYRTNKAYAAGSILAATFAHLQDNNFPLALLQLQHLQQQVQQPPQNRSVSAVTLSSIRKATERLQAASDNKLSSSIERQRVAELLAVFQQDYENSITKAEPQQLVLYRAGIWVFNASLAVAAEDAGVLTQGDFAKQLDYLQKAFVRLKAPVGVQNSLHEIAVILAQQSLEHTSLSRKDFRALQQSLQNLNILLG